MRAYYAFSSAIDFYVAANPTELNSDGVRITCVYRGAVGWFDADFPFVLQRVRAVYICFPSRTESNRLIEHVVLRREWEKGCIRAVAANSIEMIEWRPFR